MPREIPDGENLQINTKTRLKDGSEYSVDYKLYLTPAGWRVYDVIIEGVSLVNNYRSQFDRVLNKKSFDALLLAQLTHAVVDGAGADAFSLIAGEEGTG